MSGKRQVEMPCLGRHLTLGTSYDLCSDKSGDKLWNDIYIKQAKKVEKHDSVHCDIKVIDEDKSSEFNLSPHAKLSILGELITVTGSSKYYKPETKYTNENSVQVVLRYVALSKTERLLLDSDIMKQNHLAGTHVVTTVTWGLRAFFVFTRELRGEKRQLIQKSLSEKVQLLKEMCEGNTCADMPKDEGEVCTFFADFTVPNNEPTNLHDAMDICRSLSKHSSEENFLPLKVTLYPFTEADLHIINETLIDKVDLLFRCWLEMEQRATNLKKNDIMDSFPSLRQKVEEFKEALKDNRMEFSKTLRNLTTRIRSNTANESELEGQLNEFKQSPFHYTKLKIWLDKRTKEVYILNRYVDQLNGCTHLSDEDLIKHINGKTYDKIICFEFNVKQMDEEYLQNMKAWSLQDECKKTKSEACHSWSDDPSVTEKIELKIQQYKALTKSTEENTMYVYTEKSSNSTCTISTSEPLIVTYMDGKANHHDASIGTAIQMNVTKECSEPLKQGDIRNSLPTTNPSMPEKTHSLNLALVIDKPGKPTALLISNGVSLTWAKPSKNAHCINFYTISYCCTESSQEWKTLKTSTNDCESVLTSLQPGKEYIFKVCPECENGVGEESDLSDPVFMNIISKPGKPAAFCIDKHSIKLKWKEPTFNTDKVIKYTVMYICSSLANDWVKKDTDGNQTTIVISDLTPNMKYIFKVIAEGEEGPGIESELSDPIETMHKLPDKPGVPYLLRDSESQVLQWAKPDRSSQHVKCYTVLYRSANSPEDKWKEKATTDDQEKLTLDSFKGGEDYIFKVRSESEMGPGPESDLSKPITINNGADDIVQIEHSNVGFDDRLTVPEKYTKESRRNSSCSPVTSTIIENLASPTLLSKTSHSIHLKWNRPTLCDEGDTLYKLLYQKSRFRNSNWNEEQIQGHEITIHHLDDDTNYFFKVSAEVCQLESKIIEIRTLPRTQIPGKPSKPLASQITGDSVHLQWNEPKDKPFLTKSYTVLYRSPDHLSTEWKKESTHGKLTHMKVENLESGTHYEFKVRSETESCPGPESDCSDIIITKKYFSRVGKPGKPIAGEIFSNSVSIKWTKPDTNIPDLKEYDVFYRVTTDPTDAWTYYRSIPKGTNKTTIKSLKPKFAYFFKVRSVGKYGPGDESEVSDVIKTRAILPGKPGKPTCTVKGVSVEVHWKPPKDNIRLIKCYKVGYKSTKEPETEWKYEFTCGKTENVMLNSLDTEKLYHCQVCSVSDDGLSPLSDISQSFKILRAIPQKEISLNAHNISHNSIDLLWTSIDRDPLTQISYTVLYCPSEGNSSKHQWTPVCAKDNLSVVVNGLSPGTGYFFKVRTETEDHVILYESNVKHFTTRKNLPGKPQGKPISTCETYNSIRLSWNKPDYGPKLVQRYTIFRRALSEKADQVQNWIQVAEAKTNYTVIKGLLPNNQYVFKVRPEGKEGSGPESDSSDPCSTIESIAKFTQSKSETKIIERGPPDVYKLNVDVCFETDYYAKVAIDFGVRDSMKLDERVLIIVGATGVGKSTLINGFANYILGVSWEDDFRFKVIVEEEEKYFEAQSQTKRITAYNFHPMEGSHIPYSLTIIDTPGFGDTSGLERDQQIIDQIKNFFSCKGEGGIDHLHGVGFVVPSTEVRLTPTQVYIYESIFSIFGSDIKDNIFLMATFSDGKEPEVLPALKQAGIDTSDMFKFNNSALYAKKNTPSEQFDKLFWELGISSFESFFCVLSRAIPQSLQLTKQVLHERAKINAVMIGIHHQIIASLSDIHELQQVQQYLLDNNAQTNVEIVRFARVMEKKPLQTKDEFATNCNNCQVTCHYPCRLGPPSKLRSCIVMEHGHCTVCEQRCCWDNHRSENFKLENSIIEEKIMLPALSLPEYYCPGNQKLHEAVATIEKKMEEQKHKIFGLIQEAVSSLNRLKKIALRPDPLTVVDYIDTLLQNEQHKAEPGYYERICELCKIKEYAKGLDIKKFQC